MNRTDTLNRAAREVHKWPDNLHSAFQYGRIGLHFTRSGDGFALMYEGCGDDLISFGDWNAMLPLTDKRRVRSSETGAPVYE